MCNTRKYSNEQHKLECEIENGLLTKEHWNSVHNNAHCISNNAVNCQI